MNFSAWWASVGGPKLFSFQQECARKAWNYKQSEIDIITDVARKMFARERAYGCGFETDAEWSALSEKLEELIDRDRVDGVGDVMTKECAREIGALGDTITRLKKTERELLRGNLELGVANQRIRSTLVGLMAFVVRECIGIAELDEGAAARIQARIRQVKKATFPKLRGIDRG